MFLNVPTIATIALCIVGTAVACPVLIAGFKRRGTGIKHESVFLIQRAPQYASLLNIVCVVLSFLACNHKFFTEQLLLSVAGVLPQAVASSLSYAGLVLQLSGFVFMVGGWYSLGEYFSTDAELLREQKVKRTWLFGCVMHPAYSGIIQTLLGFALTALSPLSAGITLFLVAPLWLNRARYEEKLLLENLGEPYNQYGNELHWRRIVPRCFPFGL